MRKICLYALLIALFYGCSVKDNNTKQKSIPLSSQINLSETELIKQEKKLYDKGFNAYKRGDFHDSLKYLKKLVTLKKRRGNRESVAEIYPIVALSYQSIGDYKNALIYYEKALNILNDKNLNKTLSYTGMGEIYKELGDYKKALTNYQKALKIIENRLGKNNINTTMFYDKIGLLFMEMQNYPKSLEILNKSLAIKKSVTTTKKIDIALSYMSLGSVYYRMRNYSKALDYYNKELNLKLKFVGQNHPIISTSYNNIGLVYLDIHNYQRALKHFKKALHIQENIFKSNHIIITKSYYNIALTYKGMNNYQKAYTYAKKTFDSFSINQNKGFIVLDNSQKLKYLKSTKMYLSGLITSTYLYNYKKEKYITFNTWLNYKRIIFDYENTLKTLYQKTTNQSIKNNIDKLFNYQKTLAKLHQNIPNNKKIKELQNKISKLEITLSDLKQKDITYHDISKHLEPNELYIDFVKSGDSYYCFTLDKKENITFIKIDKDKIDSTIKTIQNETSKNISTAKKHYGKLYKLIFKNIDIKNRTSLIISPDGLLNSIPFEALHDGKQYLIQKLNIRYIPSGKEFVKLYENSNSSNNRVVVFANPAFGLNQNSTNSSQLKGSTIETLYREGTIFKTLSNRDEPDIIEKLYGKKSRLYLGKDATESNFFKIKSPKILHLSTHGFYLKDKSILNPMLKAGIALSGANHSIKNRKGDGIITGLELSGIDLTHTKLVVLSACETGVGELEDGEGVAGINKAFIKAGAKYIIMALWSVPEKSTGVLMKRFYENIYKGQSYSEALREAKIWMIENKHSHPFYWSGFVGSGRD